MAKATTTQRVVVRDAGAKRKRKKLKKVAYGVATGSSSRPGRFSLKIKPSAKVRGLLRQGKKLSVTVAVTFAPARGAPNTKTTRVRVRLRKSRRR